MKKPSATFLLVASLALGAASPLTVSAADGHDHGHAAASQGMADGVVKKVDSQAGRLTIKHGPLPNGMPAMTMAFKAASAEILSGIKPGDAVRFAIEDVAGVMTVTKINKAR